MALSTLSIDVEARLAKLEEGLDRASRIVQRSSTEMSRRFDGINVAAVSLARTLAVGFVTAGITRFTSEAIRGLDALNDFKDATGASIENASALEDVAARTGTSFETATDAVVKLNKVLADAKPGSTQANLLQSIGLNAQELRKIDPAEALLKVSQALAKYQDDGNKARIIQELFGKGVKEIAPLLNDLAEKGKLVGTTTEEAAKQAEKFRQQLDGLAKNSADTARIFASALLPALNKALEDFNKTKFGVLDLVAALSKLVTLPIGGALFTQLKEGLSGTSTELQQLEGQLARMQQLQKLNPGAVRPENLARLQAQVDALRTSERVQQRLQSPFDPSAGADAIRAIKSSAPDIGGATGKAKDLKFPDAKGAADDAFQSAFSRLQGTDFAKIEQLNRELEKLLEIQRQFGEDAGGGIAQAIQQTSEEIDKLKVANFTTAITDPLEATKSAFLRTEQEFTNLPKPFEKATDEMTEFARQAARNIQDALGTTLKQLLKGNFDDIGSLFGDLLLNMVAQAGAARIGNALFGKDFLSGTGSIGGLVKDLFFSANGNVFAPGGVQTFARGDVFSSPTAFGFGSGRVGVMGEAGPEAVVPLKRGRDGKLGIAGGGITLNPTYYIGEGVQMGQVVSAVQQGNKQLLEQLRAAGAIA